MSNVNLLVVALASLSARPHVQFLQALRVPSLNSQSSLLTGRTKSLSSNNLSSSNSSALSAASDHALLAFFFN